MSRLQFSTLRPADLFAMDVQPSQSLVLGMAHSWDQEQAELLTAQPVAWCARSAEAADRGRILACFGIVEMFEGSQGYGWAALAPGIGAAHFELTRFVQGQIAGCGLSRLELRAVASPQFERDLAAAGGDQADAVKVAFRRSTPEMRWAVLLGLQPVHVLRQYGAAREAFVLFELIRPAVATLARKAA